MKHIFLKVLFIGFLSFIGFWAGNTIAHEQAQQKEYNNILFTTVISGDENSSVEEKETASHFFAEAILGWTISPTFIKNIGFSLSGKKQERGNIIFQFASKTPEEGQTRSEILSKEINTKLKQYNNRAKTEFVLLFEPLQTEEKQFKKFSWGIIGAMLGFFIALFMIEGVRLISFFKKEKK